MKVLSEIIVRVFGVTLILGAVLLVLSLLGKAKVDGAAREAEMTALLDDGVALGDRRFYVGQSGDAVEDTTLYISRLAFLRPILATAPNGRVYAFLIYGTSVGRFVTQREHMEEIRSGERSYSDAAQDRLVAGYEAYVETDKALFRVKLLPTASENAHIFTCNDWLGDDGNFVCDLRADYPIDPTLQIRRLMVMPKPIGDVSAVLAEFALRSIEIAKCLDITTKPNPASEADFLAAHRDLSECAVLDGP